MLCVLRQVTHLVAAEGQESSAKFTTAKQRGLPIISESEMRYMLGAPPATPRARRSSVSSKRKRSMGGGSVRKAQRRVSRGPDGLMTTEIVRDSGVLNGCVICLSEGYTQPLRDITADITSAGGFVVNVLNSSVTHLLVGDGQELSAKYTIALQRRTYP